MILPAIGIVLVAYSEALDAAAEWAAPRPLSDAWVIDRKRSKVDTAPLVAVTVAVAALVGAVDEEPPPPPNCW
jgi:hypothetical protein